MLEKELIDAMYKLSDREYQNNLYKNRNLWEDNHISDENQSVKWNREQVIEHNKSVYEEYRRISNEIVQQRINLHHEAYLYFKNRWEDDKFTEPFFQHVWNKAVNEEDDCCAYYYIFTNVMDILEEFYKMLELREQTDDKESD